VEFQDKIGLCKKTVIASLKVLHYFVGRTEWNHQKSLSQ